MRILVNPEQPAAISASAPAPTPAAPVVDTQRTSALERLVDALREKIRSLEERLQMLEQAPKVMPVPAPTPARPAITPATVDTEAVKKNLNKMWKYLQDDERPSKAV